MKPSRTELLTEALIALDSVTPHDKGCQHMLIAQLAPLGFVCETITSNGVTNLWARKGTTSPVFVFAGHTDVVPPGPASSETGGLGWRRSHRDDYRLFPYLGRDPQHASAMRRILPDGSTELQPPQDSLVWSGERSFAVGARSDGAVQVGGVNVFPARIRAVLLEHPDVADAAVRLMRADEGVRLKAYIVPRDGNPDAGAALLAPLRAWIDARLAAPERPKALTFGPALPRSAMGKPADWTIR